MGLHSASAHPFTICSLPPPADDDDDDDDDWNEKKGRGNTELRFVVKRGGGLTRKLYALAQERPGVGVRVGIDGPYGGVGRRLSGFERVLVVAGGSGAGFTLPVVEEVVRRNVRGSGGARRTEVRVVIATRDAATREWYTGEVRGLLERYGGGAREMPLVVSVHVTGEAAEDMETGKVQNGGEQGGGVLWKTGRPELPRLIREYAAEDGGSLGITVCGPAEMLYDVRNAAAEVQKDVIGGKGPREVYLHSEHFS